MPSLLLYKDTTRLGILHCSLLATSPQGGQQQQQLQQQQQVTRMNRSETYYPRGIQDLVKPEKSTGSVKLKPPTRRADPDDTVISVGTQLGGKGQRVSLTGSVVIDLSNRSPWHKDRGARVEMKKRR